MKIAFLGDISLNDNYNSLYNNGEKPFDKIGSILKKNDYIVGNLECLVAGDSGENVLKNPRLKTNLTTLNFLNDIGVNVVELAHNHVFDNLKDGFEKTISFLDENNIRYLGASTIKGEESKPLIIEKNGMSVCLLNYVTHDTNPSLPSNADVYPNWFDEKKVISHIIENKKKYDYVFLLLHWGGRCEGGLYPDWDQPKIARRLIDAGADIIIGNHSHTIQPYELYNGKYIFYSLGNFCFADLLQNDGTYSNQSIKRKKLSRILMISLSVNSLNINIHCTKRNNNGGIDFTYYTKSLKQIMYRLFFLNKVIWCLYFSYLKKLRPFFLYFFFDNISLMDKMNKISVKNIIKQLKK